MKNKGFSLTTFLILFLSFLFSANISTLSQVAGDYRSAASGNWSTLSTWERYNGSTWVTPTNAPTSNSGVITIQTGHTVTIAAANQSADQMIINSGGQLTINSGRTLTINNGDGTDLIAYGTLLNSGTLNLNGGPSLVFESGSTYQHNKDGGNIPLATWNVNSTCLVTGVITNMPGNNIQLFGNFTWNCTGQTRTVDFDRDVITPTPSGFRALGNVNILSTGSLGLSTLRFSNDRDNIVSGNFTQSGGITVLRNNNAHALIVLGNFSLTAGTLRNEGGNSSTCSITVGGNFTNTGGTLTNIASSPAPVNIIFNKIGTQIFQSGGTISGIINYIVNSNSTLQMDLENTVVNGTTFTLSNGATLGIRSSLGITTTGATGNIQVTGSRTFNSGANYLYNGSTLQEIGNGFPNNLTGILTIDNPGNTVSLKEVRTVSNGGIINLTAGVFSTGINLSMASTSSITRNDGSMSGTLQGAGLYNVTFEHNSKTTGPELSGSGLNNVTVKLDAGESLTLDQSRNARGTLTMTTGDILLNGNNFTLGITGQAGVLSYSSGLMQGPGTFTRWFTTNAILLGTEAGLFPMGYGTDNRSVWLAGIPAAAGSLSVTHTNADGTTPISFIENSLTFDKRTNMSWSITPANGFSAALPNLALRIQGSGIPGINSVSDLNICISTEAAGGIYSAPGGTITDPQVNRTGMTSGDLTNTFYFASTSASPLPVELSSFSASIFESKVKLNWRTETEVNNYGFEILRSSQIDNAWKKIGFVAGNGNSNSPKEYSFIDEEVISGKYFYKLKQIDNDGKFAFSKIIEIEVNIPKEYKLSQNYPNPFNPVTQISYSLPKAEYVVLKVYNILGSEVAVLENSMKEPGNYTISFNGAGLASGIYFYTLEAGNFKATKKMILTK